MFDHGSGGDVAREMIRGLGISPELETGTDAPLVEEFERLDDEFSDAAKHHRAVRERAYEIWENEGRPHGWDVEHWLTAEQQIAEHKKA